MKSSDLISNRVPFTATFEGGKVQGAFNPQVLTPAYRRDKLGDAEWLGGGVLVEWDLEGSDGQPIPITTEAFDAVPEWIIAGVVLAIIETRRPNLTNSAS